MSDSEVKTSAPNDDVSETSPPSIEAPAGPSLGSPAAGNAEPKGQAVAVHTEDPLERAARTARPLCDQRGDR